MSEFVILIGQIFVIGVIQIIIEVFINMSDKPYQSKIINIACFMGSFYLLLDCTYNYLLKDISRLVNISLF